MAANKKAPKTESVQAREIERDMEFINEEKRRDAVLKDKETRRILRGIAESVEDVARPFWDGLDRLVVTEQSPELGKEARTLITRRVDKLQDVIEEVVTPEDVGAGLVSEERVVEDVSHALRTPLTSLKGYLQLFKLSGVGEKQREDLLGKIRKNVLLVRREFLDIRDLYRFGGLEDRPFYPDKPKGYSKEGVRQVSTEQIEAVLNNVVQYESAGGSGVVITGGEKKEVDAAKERGSAGVHLRRALENVIGGTLQYFAEDDRVSVAFDPNARTVTVTGEIKEKMMDDSSALDRAVDHVRYRGWFRGRDIAAGEPDEPSHGLGLAAAVAEAHLKFVGGEMEQEIVDQDGKKILKTTVRFA